MRSLRVSEGADEMQMRQLKDRDHQVSIANNNVDGRHAD